MYRLSKLISEQRCLLILSILALLVFFFTIKPLQINIPESWIDAFRQCLLTISGSFVSGYIFYVFSVLLPKAIRMGPIIEISKENLRYARDEIVGLFFEHGGPSDILNAKTEELIKYIAEPHDNDMYVIHDNACKYLHGVTKQVKEYMQFVISHSDYLLDEDINRLKDIISHLRNVECRLRQWDNSEEEIKAIPYDNVSKGVDVHNAQSHHINEVLDVIDKLKIIYEELNHLSRNIT